MLMLFCVALAFLYSAMRSIYMALSMASVSPSPLTVVFEGFPGMRRLPWSYRPEQGRIP